MADAMSETEVQPERTPRRRAAKTAAVSTGPARRTRVRKTDSVGGPAATSTRTAAPARKAPTPISTERAAVRTGRRQVMVTTLIILSGFVSSAAVGYLDQGAIDVNQTIAARNERIERGELQDDIIPVQNPSREPDGGLIGLGIGGPETPPAPATTTASTSDDTASSSDEATDTVAEG